MDDELETKTAWTPEPVYERRELRVSLSPSSVGLSIPAWQLRPLAPNGR